MTTNAGGGGGEAGGGGGRRGGGGGGRQRCEALFAEARRVALGLPGGQSVAQVDFYRAHVLLSDGERHAAEGLVRGASGRSTNADFLGWCRWALGWIALLDDDVDAAAAEFDASLVLGDGVDDESLRAHVCSALALVAALRGDGDSADAMAARAVRSAERMVGAPRVLMMALAHAGQAAGLVSAGRAATPTTRLLRMLRDIGVTYWADEALDVTGLVLAERFPDAAGAALCAARPIGEGEAGSGRCGTVLFGVAPGSSRSWEPAGGRPRRTGHGQRRSTRRSATPWPRSKVNRPTNPRAHRVSMVVITTMDTRSCGAPPLGRATVCAGR